MPAETHVEQSPMSRQEVFELVRDRLHALASIVATLREVFPAVEVWTERGAADPDAQLVFIALAGQTPTATDSIAINAPDPHLAERLPQTMLDRLLESRRAMVLTDDYAPIDRLMGSLK